ncbi:PH domain-containing protein [Brevibacterium litoralis]|uniref:PH domain-containing protein n=1 Tax=Brevibacterium litoralis TaxID=3138935 RepID=UPI0032EDDE7F
MTESVTTEPVEQTLRMPEFVPVSPKYVWLELLGTAIVLAVVLVGLVVLKAFTWNSTVTWWIAGIVLGLVVIDVVVTLIVVPRQARALGYAEREEDLLVRRGILFRKITVVPYGRLQYVEVESGPIERGFGLATVKLHTASANSDATVKGIPREDADRLRDSLAARGESRLAGL